LKNAKRRYGFSSAGLPPTLQTTQHSHPQLIKIQVDYGYLDGNSKRKFVKRYINFLLGAVT